MAGGTGYASEKSVRALWSYIFSLVWFGMFLKAILIHGASPEQGQLDNPGTANQTANCVITKEVQDIAFAATLSPTVDTVKLECSMGPSLNSDKMIVEPSLSRGSDLVCPATGKLVDCGFKLYGEYLKIKEICGQNSTVTPYENGKKGGFAVKVPKEDRKPGLDRLFRVGCAPSRADAGIPTNSCHLDVTVPATESAVSDKQVVSCSYGANSNPKTQQVSVDPSKNHVTVDCGTEGDIAPSTFETAYCSDDKLTSCDKKYADLFTGYQPTWWGSVGGARTVTIPKDSFPETAKSVYVGCKPKAELVKGALNPTPCIVQVTFTPKGSSAKGYSGVHVTLFAVLFAGMGWSVIHF
ncbi:srs domain-containing protein [Cystoisospora suis]|uniref:Srs domain-containing protein n=1 Tax=Cystoisospora suis TaxID=483139 RepID=A0A2C6KMJ5_9APIC|nr:srs domain-containing protein [Cystoisospora suis]